MTHLRLPSSLIALAAIGFASPALGQTNAPPTMTVQLDHDTGLVTSQGGDFETVAAFHVNEPGAAWMRLYFSDVQLGGNLAEGTGAMIKITSLEDGYHQLLNAQTVEEWNHSTAYFNGDLLFVEVIAGPGTGPSRVALDRADLGLWPDGAGPDSICGTTDDRVPSSDPRVARILPIGCTGWLINDACNCSLTAGHCLSGTSVMQFNVPASNANGSLNNPPPSDQYSVDQSSKQGIGGGIGNDWGYYGTFPNSTTGLTAAQAQGAVFNVISPPSWSSGLEVRITGHGTDGGVRNQVQQTHVGPWVQYTGGNRLQYMTDTTGGNSGSPVIQEQNGGAMGIHTHAGCTSGGGANNGTSSTNSGLQNALANPKGVCFKTGPPTCGTVPTTTSTNGTGVNPVCLTSVTPPAIGTTWTLQVDPSVVAGANFSLLRAQAPGPPTSIPLGEVLLSLGSKIIFTSTRSGAGPHDHTISVPSLIELAGFTSRVQGVVGVNGEVQQLCNALDFTVGCEQP
jgi:V8-like Glu-specific endopeptidase